MGLVPAETSIPQSRKRVLDKPMDTTKRKHKKLHGEEPGELKLKKRHGKGDEEATSPKRKCTRDMHNARITNANFYVFNDKIYNPYGNLLNLRLSNKKNMKDGNMYGIYVEHGIIFSPQVGTTIMDTHIHDRALQLVKGGCDPVKAHHSESHDASTFKVYPPALSKKPEKWYVKGEVIIGNDHEPYNSELVRLDSVRTLASVYVKDGVIHDKLWGDSTLDSNIKLLTFKYINEGMKPISARQHAMHLTSKAMTLGIPFPWEDIKNNKKDAKENN